jgi:hypothetical protein
MSEPIPAVLFHPAEIIEEELQERDWTLDDVMLNSGPYYEQKEYGITRLALELYLTVRETDILMDDTVAGALSRALDISPGFFWSLHNNWRVAEIARKQTTA